MTRMARSHFHFRSLEELQQTIEKLGVSVPLEYSREQVQHSLAQPVQVGRFRVGNSLAIHPMEGCDGTLSGSPDELTWRRYERFATGGAKLIWVEATAVVEEGRANSRQLWLHPGNVGDFARLLEMTRSRHAETFGQRHRQQVERDRILDRGVRRELANTGR